MSTAYPQVDDPPFVPVKRRCHFCRAVFVAPWSAVIFCHYKCLLAQQFFDTRKDRDMLHLWLEQVALLHRGLFLMMKSTNDSDVQTKLLDMSNITADLIDAINAKITQMEAALQQ